MNPIAMKASIIVLVFLGIGGEAAIVAQQTIDQGGLSTNIVVPAVLVVAAIGGLASLVWRMLSARIDRVERTVDKHEERMRDIDRLIALNRAMHKNLTLIPEIHNRLHGMDDSILGEPGITDEP